MFRRWRNTELLANPFGIGARLAEGAGNIARVRQRMREAERRSLAQRIDPGQLAPQRDRFCMVMLRACRAGQVMQRCRMLARQPPALLLGPFLEALVAQEKPVEKWPVIQGHCLTERSTRQRRPELLHIALDDRGIETQGIYAGEGAGRGEVPPNGVNELIERVAGVFGGALRPEAGDELVPAQSLRARGRDDGKQGQPAALQWLRQPSRIAEHERAKRLEVEHEHPVRAV